MSALVVASMLTVFGARPPEVGYVDSLSLPLRVHYQETVSEAYAKEILAAAEASWRKMFQEMGFLAPLPDLMEGGSDAYDFYVVTNLPQGVGGYTSFSGFDEASPRQDAYGYTVVSHDLKPLYLRGVVAHELAHGSQMAYDWWESISFMEATSTWITEHAFPDEDFYWRYYVYFNRKPWQALNFVSLADPYQYGAGMFLSFLDEAYGHGDGVFVRGIWEKAVQDDITNEPDYLDVIDHDLDGQGGLKAAFLKFAEWRLVVGSRDDGYHFREGKIWGESVDPFFDVDGMIPAMEDFAALAHPLQPYSHAFLRFTSDPGGWRPRTFEAITDEPVELATSWFVFAPGLRCKGDRPEVDPTCAGTLAPDEPREVVVAITNFGAGDFDADTSQWHATPVTWRFEAIRPF